MSDKDLSIENFLHARTNKNQLRFMTCGSVDDGKSTLLGRLLLDSKSVFEDQLHNTQLESQKYGTQGQHLDPALLLDGLQAEREQGITIDVAYRYFETDKRKFIAADAPGHEQYTRNMATAASSADLAIILVDARNGILTQTRRHSYIASLMGVPQIVLAINKMDLVNYEATRFEQIVGDYQSFSRGLGISQVQCIPLCALNGDNVYQAKGAMPWYTGPSLMGWLESVIVNRDHHTKPLRLPVQRVNRPSPEFRGYSGTIAAGTVAVGDPVYASLSDQTASVKQILAPGGPVEYSQAGQAVTVVLDNQLDISRGELLAAPSQAPTVADQFAAHLLWMDTEPMLPERTYMLRLASATAVAQVTDLSYRVEINSLEKLAAKTLRLNEIGYCKLALDRPLAFDPYAEIRDTGAFILIDTYSNATAGAGTIDFALRRASNIEWHTMKIDKSSRAQINQQKPCVLWFTGLSGAGKSTVADKIEQKLHAQGKRTYLLDGDNVRHGLNKDLGFTDQDRVENIRRVAEVAKLLVDAGLIVLVSFISPFRSERQMARALMEADEFIEIFVDAPLALCEQRDPKGLYKKARAGELKNFTGIDSEYEPPEHAELVLSSAEMSAETLANQVIAYLNERFPKFSH